MTAEPSLSRILHNRKFAPLWTAGLISQVGDRLNEVALAILVYQLSGSNTVSVGEVMLLGTLPAALLSPIAGAYVDRWDRKRTMIAADLVRALLVALLPSSGSLTSIYLITFVVAAASQFFEPAKSAIIPQLVTDKELTAANALTSFTFQLAKALGPALAGILIVGAGVSAAFYLNALSFLLSALLLGLLRTGGTAVSSPKSSLRQVGQEMVDGLAFMCRERLVLSLTVLMVVATLGAGASPVMILPFAERVLRVNMDWYGLIVGTMGIGMILGSVLIGVSGRRIGDLTLLRGGLMVTGVAYLAFANLPFLPLTFLLRLLIGVGWIAFSIASTTALQRAVPDALLGRVFASYLAAMRLATALSMWIMGIAAAVLPIELVLSLLGMFILGAGFLSLWWLGPAKIAAPSVAAAQSVASQEGFK